MAGNTGEVRQRAGRKSVALETKCLTSGAIFHSKVWEGSVSVSVELPFKLDISEEEAELIERLMHNQLELVLRPYFNEAR